jgi:hypothetical protein
MKRVVSIADGDGDRLKNNVEKNVRVGRAEPIFPRGAPLWSPRATHPPRRAVRRASRASSHPARVPSVPHRGTPSVTVRGIGENRRRDGQA